jgi:two-component system chemotaxis response regulator CheY
MHVKDCFANRHLLVLGDEAFIRTVVSRFLRRSGAASVAEAADGGSAIRAMADYALTFAAVISDINVQPVNEIELLRAIRTGQDGVKRSTPVLMLTVHSEVELVAEAVALDADAFVLKPIHRDDLIERVCRVLEQPVPVKPAEHYATVAQNFAPGAN